MIPMTKCAVRVLCKKKKAYNNSFMNYYNYAFMAEGISQTHHQFEKAIRLLQ